MVSLITCSESVRVTATFQATARSRPNGCLFKSTASCCFKSGQEAARRCLNSVPRPSVATCSRAIASAHATTAAAALPGSSRSIWSATQSPLPTSSISATTGLSDEARSRGTPPTPASVSTSSAARSRGRGAFAITLLCPLSVIKTMRSTNQPGRSRRLVEAISWTSPKTLRAQSTAAAVKSASTVPMLPARVRELDPVVEPERVACWCVARDRGCQEPGPATPPQVGSAYQALACSRSPVELTIPAAVKLAADQFGDAVAIAEPDGLRLSYNQLHERVQGLAGALAVSGVEAGDRVAIWSPNTHHWVLAGLGALTAGATLVLVNTRFTGSEALDVIGRSRATALIV